MKEEKLQYLEDIPKASKEFTNTGLKFISSNYIKYEESELEKRNYELKKLVIALIEGFGDESGYDKDWLFDYINEFPILSEFI